MRRQSSRIIGWASALLVASLLSPADSCAATLKLGGTGAGLGTMRLLADAFSRRSPGTTIEIHSSIGSSGGINAVVAGVLDIGISSRPLSDDERKRGAQDWAYAKTPFIFVTGKKSTQARLTTEEIIGIYAGTLTKWNDGTSIRLVLRPRTETDTLLVKKYFPGMEVAMEKAYSRRGLPIASTDQDTADSIQKTVGAVGPSTLALILAENRPLKALALNNVAPTVENIGNGSYPMTKTFYLVTGPRSKAEVQRFIDFIRSSEGAAILYKTGHFVIGPGER